jgi:hypothetical protein
MARLQRVWKFLQKMGHQQWDVVLVLPQRGQLDWYSVQSEIQVLAKRPRPLIGILCMDPTGLISFSCRARNNLACKKSGNSPISSKVPVMSRNFPTVEKDRSLVSGLEQTQLRAVCTRDGAFDLSEQFGLD